MKYRVWPAQVYFEFRFGTALIFNFAMTFAFRTTVGIQPNCSFLSLDLVGVPADDDRLFAFSRVSPAIVPIRRFHHAQRAV